MKKRILVIDDDPAILDVLQEMLKGNNYEVKAIGRADKIFEEIDEFNPELILLDVMLAGMDGRYICKSIKGESAYKNFPIILISANINNYNVMFEPHAPNDFIAKPFDMYDLLSKIETHLAA